MFFKDFGKACVFSAISGTIRSNGAPVAGLVLVRKGKWQKWQSDSTVTDGEGYFSFPVMTERSIAKYLPQEFVARQKLYTVFEGREMRIWSGVKREPEENVESRGKTLEVECDLTRDEILTMISGGAIFSICTWDVEPDKHADLF